MLALTSGARRLAGLVLAFVLGLTAQSLATTGALSVRIVDALTVRPISTASVTLPDRHNESARNAGNGTYVFDSLAPGTYRIEIVAPGHESVVRTVTIAGAIPIALSVALGANDEATQLHAIARVTAVGQDRPDLGPSIHTTLGSETLADAGAFRLADALVEVPELNATETGYTTQANGPGSSIYMDVRGLGAIETLSMVDGHPLGEGIDLGYNFQNAPIFGLQETYVGYGTGASGLASYGTGGGIIDMRTLDPTLTPHANVLQGFGSWGRMTTAFNATGSTANGSIGYAFAYGVEGSSGPLGSQQIYAPTASWDPSSAQYIPGATYELTQETLRRSFLGKLRFKLGPSSYLTLHELSNVSTADGTGNSDDIYEPYNVALAQGQQRLTNKSAGDPCAAGTFTVLNEFGIPEGTGRNFGPDGGVACQTPQQYANFNMGWQGYGPHRVSNYANDYDVRYDTYGGNNTFSLDTFTNAYNFFYDRTQFLPFFATPGDTGFSLMYTVVNTGVVAMDHLDLGDNQLGFMARYMNNTNRFAETATPLQAPAVNDRAFAVEDLWNPAGSPLDARLRLSETSSTATDTSFLDPHADVEYRLGARDRARFSAGSAAVQPPGAWLGLPFVPTPAAQFSSDITCSGVNPIGSAPSSVLKPERADDADLAYTHNWTDEDYTTVDLYTENLFNKIYDTTIPLSQLPAGAISAATTAPYQALLTGACGAATPASLGATGYVNVGRIQARGAELVGRQRILPSLALAYAWSEESAILRDANVEELEANPTMILNAQLPNVPMHKASLGLQYGVPAGVAASFTEYFVSANNPANLPAYDYANAAVGIPIGHGVWLRGIVYNVFDQYASNEQIAGLGYPLALNSYALPGAYLPYIGSGATIYEGLAPRRFEVTLRVER